MVVPLHADESASALNHFGGYCFGRGSFALGLGWILNLSWTVLGLFLFFSNACSLEHADPGPPSGLSMHDVIVMWALSAAIRFLALEPLQILLARGCILLIARAHPRADLDEESSFRGPRRKRQPPAADGTAPEAHPTAGGGSFVHRADGTGIQCRDESPRVRFADTSAGPAEPSVAKLPEPEPVQQPGSMSFNKKVTVPPGVTTHDDFFTQRQPPANPEDEAKEQGVHARMGDLESKGKEQGGGSASVDNPLDFGLGHRQRIDFNPSASDGDDLDDLESEYRLTI